MSGDEDGPEFYDPFTGQKSPVKERQNAYKVLGLPIGSTKDKIRKRYLELVLTSHPDKTRSSDTSNFRKIKNAYDLINGFGRKKKSKSKSKSKKRSKKRK